MTVAELALLRITGDGTFTEAIKAELRKAKEAMETYTGRTFHYLQQVEDPACIYVLGEWDSLEDHYKGFIPTDVNQDVLKALGGKLEVERLVHLNLAVKDLSLRAPMLSIGRVTLSTEDRAALTKYFESTALPSMRAYLTEGDLAYGWRQEESTDGTEELYIIGPFRDLEQHLGYAKSAEGAEVHKTMMSWAKGMEGKHVKVLEI